jgi:hypothetical protein
LTETLGVVPRHVNQLPEASVDKVVFQLPPEMLLSPVERQSKVVISKEHCEIAPATQPIIHARFVSFFVDLEARIFFFEGLSFGSEWNDVLNRLCEGLHHGICAVSEPLLFQSPIL